MRHKARVTNICAHICVALCIGHATCTVRLHSTPIRAATAQRRGVHIITSRNIVLLLRSNVDSLMRMFIFMFQIWMHLRLPWCVFVLQNCIYVFSPYVYMCIFFSLLCFHQFLCSIWTHIYVLGPLMHMRPYGLVLFCFYVTCHGWRYIQHFNVRQCLSCMLSK